ncbi:MAG: hypothetical protein SFV51_17265 [Bryobacteraceae bacterium]|nr:hypothetical protein [Bryobacteraceae bacterium]
MAALPYPTYGISNLYLFPLYQTREAYFQATGKEAPPYNPLKPIKSWFDPKASENPRRTIVYNNVIALADNGQPLADDNGKPYTEPLLINRDDAGAVNIPVKDFNKPAEPTTGFEVPVPMREMEEGEELYFQFGGAIAVRNKALWDNLEEGFTASDRALLHAIAEKLGIGR